MVMYAGGQVTNRLLNGVWQKVAPLVNKASDGAKATHAVKEIAKDSIKPVVTSEGTANAATAPKLKLDLKTTQAANEVVESLKATGKLPQNYITKAEAVKQGWREGKALNNHVLGSQIGGDIYKNTEGILPSTPGRTWYEADIGLLNTSSRASQAGTRLVYSNDGLIYITNDHYKTVNFIGKWKD